MNLYQKRVDGFHPPLIVKAYFSPSVDQLNPKPTFSPRMEWGHSDPIKLY